MHDLRNPPRAVVGSNRIELPDLTWHEGANCKDISNEVMMPYPFPIGRLDKFQALAEQICEGCPVFKECEDTFKKYGGYGIWAGRFIGIAGLKAKAKRFRATDWR